MVQDGPAQWDDSQRLNNKSYSMIPGIITKNANGTRSRDTKDPTVARKKDAVNGMFDYQTAFADRIGGAHDKDDWNANPVNGVCVSNRQRSPLALPAFRNKNTVNGMFNYQTAFADRVGNDWDGKPKPGVSVNNRKKTQHALPASNNKNVVNGMSNYETDFADRVGGFLPIEEIRVNVPLRQASQQGATRM